jgi:glycosyltransferase involved in cell wall biosynthesis
MQANNKVILSLTTIPERLFDLDRKDNGILACLNSLLNQNYDNFEVFLNIPDFYRINGSEYIIPEHIYELSEINSQLKLNRCQDFGPSTKIAPTIRAIEDPNAIIIVMDDDFVYHEEMINDHILHLSKHADSCIGYDGMNVIGQPFGDGRDRFATFLYRDAEVSIIQHYKSVSYRRLWFEEDFFTDFLGKTRSDDILVSAYMGKQGINKIIPHSSLDDKIKGSSLDFDKEWSTKLSTYSFPIVRQISSKDNVGTKDPDALKIEDRFYMPPELDKYLNRDSVSSYSYRLAEY